VQNKEFKLSPYSKPTIEMETKATDKKQLATVIAASMHEVMTELNVKATKKMENIIAESAEKVASKFAKKSIRTMKKAEQTPKNGKVKNTAVKIKKPSEPKFATVAH